MSNQSARQASVRAVTGTTSTYEGDWHALFDANAIPAGSFNGRLLQYINAKLAASYTNLPSAMAAFAVANGATTWDSLGTFETAPPVSPILFAAQNLRGFTGGSTNAARRKVAFDRTYTLGANFYSLCLGSQGWYTANSETNFSNNFTYQETALILPNGDAINFAWDSGASKTIVAGDGPILSELLSASDFGIPYFPRGTEVRVKGLIYVPSNADKIPVNGGNLSDEGGTCLWYEDTQIPSAVANSSSFTFGGTGTTASVGSPHGVYLLGVPYGACYSWVVAGDSRSVGYSDTVNRGIYCRGWPALAARNADDENSFPTIVFGISGISSTAFVGGNMHFREWFDYCNRFQNNLGTNDVDSCADGTALFNRINAVNALATAASVPKIVVSTLVTRTYSTSGDWLGGGDQTPISARWDVGGLVEDYNDLIRADVGSGITAVIDLDGVTLDVSDRTWYSNGIADYLTNDGTHEFSNSVNGIGNEVTAAKVRNVMLNMDSISEVPTILVNPSISGIIEEEATLTAVLGVVMGSGTITPTYSWQIDGVEEGTGATFDVPVTTAGSDLTLEVTFTNSAGDVVYETTPVEITAGFNPTDIADLFAWFDPSDTSTITDTGTLTMTSKEGSAFTLTSTGTEKPSQSNLNGLNAFNYDGTNDRMGFSSAFDAIDASVSTRFVVVKSNKTTDTQTIMQSNTGLSTNYTLRWYDGFDFLITNNSTAFTFASKSLNPDTNTHVFISKQTGSGAGTIAVTYDGQPFGTASASALIAPTHGCFMGMENNSNYFSGYIAEIVVYDRALTDSEINQVGNYLADKWGITWTNI